MQKMNIGSKITELRKGLKWSQADLGNKVGVSREIIGRYERNDALPSIEIAKNIADAFGVSLDFLAGEGVNAHFDKEAIARLEEITKMNPEDKEHVFYTLDALIKNVKLKQL